jgi:ligand-binding sensor domain-containing protein/anti-sigma regulatory factor (Ser/Thr protein kinase)
MIRKSIFFFYFIILGLPLLSKSQDLLLKNYSTNEGLPSSEVYQAVQDSKGYMWFATNYGVSRFDGYQFENFDKQSGLADNTILEIYEDYKGRIWFISNTAKLSYFYNDSIHAYWNNDAFIKVVKDRPAITNKSFYVDKDDNVFIGIYLQGIYKISKSGNVSKKYPENTGVALYVEGSRVFYNSCPQPKYKLNINKDNLHFQVQLQNKTVKVSSGIHLGLIRNNGDIYYANNNFIYCVKDSSNIKDYQLGDKKIISLYYDPGNNLWAGTYTGGTICFAKGDITKEPFLSYLSGKSVTSVVCDNEGGYWFSTLTNGVYYITSIKHKNISSESGLSENSMNFLTTDGKKNVWTATLSQYINKITGDDIEKIKVFQDEEIMINALYFDTVENRLWIGTAKSIYSFANNVLQAYPTYKENSDGSTNSTQYTTYDIVRGTDGNIWLGTNKGFFKIIGKQVTHYDTKDVFLRVRSMQEDTDGGFLYGTQNGLYKFLNEKYFSCSEKNPLLKNQITFVRKCAFNNSLWLATKGEGILVVKGNDVMQILQTDGLTSNHIKHLFIDKNIIWASSDRGLNKITITGNSEEPVSIERFNIDNGLISNEINSTLVCGDKIYVATNKGLTVLDKNNLKEKNIAIPVYISGIKVNEQDTLIQEKYLLPYFKNLINISFVGLSFKNAGNVTYKYRMSGINDDWVYTKSTQVLYPFLPNGEYVFEVYAVNENGICSKVPAKVTFIISPPFWKRWWFIAISILVAAGIIFLVFYIRIKQIKRTNTLRLKLNKYMQQALSKQMNPHFIFNSLNSIQYYILNNDKFSSNKYLTKFANLMRLILDNSQQQTIPIKDELSALSLYIELESLRFEDKFEFSIVVDEKIDTSHYRIPPLLIQPYVENAIWHGLMHKEGKGLLKIEMELDENIIVCTIEDNGIGREKANEIRKSQNRKYVSKGTNITGDRLRLINTLNNIKMDVHYFDLHDTDGKACGTKVIISFPLIS